MSPEWESGIYAQGRHLNRYPYDSVVTFVYRHAPPGKPHRETRILEVGCGAGNNLWFAAREGFAVSGIDSSPTAIRYAQHRFQEEGLAGDLRTGDFGQLPFENNTFDMVIDRAALTYVGIAGARKAVAEIHRVSKIGAKFHSNVYSDRHTSAQCGVAGPDGFTQGITGGTLAGTPDVCFWRRDSFLELFATGWVPLSLQHVEIADGDSVHAEWRAVLERR
jgi:SAM-dependent methyltransferase